MMRMMQGEDDMIDVLTKSIEVSSLLFLFNNVTIMEMSQSGVRMLHLRDFIVFLCLKTFVHNVTS